jgi:hypothetical protein
VQKPDRIGQIAEHPKYLLPELRRLGFRTMIRRRNGVIDNASAMLKRGTFSLYVLFPAPGRLGTVVAWEGAVSRTGRSVGHLVLEHTHTLHLHEIIAYTNGGLYLIESLSS